MIRVRPYDVMRDLGAVLAMAQEFHAESPVYRNKPFSRFKVGSLLDNATEAPNWLPLIAEDDDGTLTGFALVTVETHFFCDVKQLLDLAIYVTPDRRGKLSFRKLMAYVEEWARAQGAEEASLGITTGINHDQALSAFQKLGYETDGIRIGKKL